MVEQSQTRAEQKESEENKYPLQEVWQMSGGHRISIGNERGKEFLRVAHPSGSYMEIQPDGKVVHFNIGESKTYNKGGVTLTVDENNDVHISGHQKLQVGGGAHIEVSGDAGVVAGGNIAVAGLGNLGVAANGNGYLGIKGKMSFNAQGGFDFQSGGPINMKAPNATLNISQIGIQGDITQAGDFNQSGTHTDSIGKHIG